MGPRMDAARKRMSPQAVTQNLLSTSTRGKLTEHPFVCFVSFAVIHFTMHVCCVCTDENREKNEIHESRREEVPW